MTPAEHAKAIEDAAEQYAYAYSIDDFKDRSKAFDVLQDAIWAGVGAAPEGWQTIESAPKDGTYILLGSADGSWIARNYPVYQSGYRPDNPWQSMMLNHEHMGRYPKAKPTHWMPLPAAPKP